MATWCKGPPPSVGWWWVMVEGYDPIVVYHIGRTDWAFAPLGGGTLSLHWMDWHLPLEPPKPPEKR